MPKSRIGEAQLEPTRPRSTQRPPLLSQASTALAAPLSVLVMVPLLVALVGLTLTWLADRALRQSNLEVARERLHDQASTVARMVRATLEQSDSVLVRLSGIALQHAPGDPIESFAHTLADLLQARPGVTYVSVSYPDGTFQGVYLDPQGESIFQESRTGVDSTTARHFRLGTRGNLVLRATEQTDYDPRERDFYKLAVAAHGPVWTRPYSFYNTHQTGITRALPIYVNVAGGDALHAVLTVDYDVSALSAFLNARRLPAMRAVLYADDGTVLAYAGDALSSALIRPQRDRTLRFGDLVDPALIAFSRVRKDGAEGSLLRIVADDRPYLAVVADAVLDEQLAWHIAYLAPEELFLRGLYAHRRQSLWVSAGVLLVALLLAYMFARHITRVRHEMRAAKAAAARAVDQARELGSYRLVECLGKGGMGEVWRAEHRLLARQAAIKLINPSAEGQGLAQHELNARFRREAEALASLRSRHTIELFDYGVAADGTFFLVMELLDGMDLETLVLRFGAQPVGRVVQLLIQACASLAEAHRVGLIHRDIKPANLFVCRAADELDVIKVLDFGLVRSEQPRSSLASPGAAPADERAAVNGHTDREQEELRALAQSLAQPATNGSGESDPLRHVTLAGGVLGTPGYMSPDQALGRDLDGRSDLYGLGCVAFWLLSGHLLFAAQDPMQRILATLTEEPDIRALLGNHVPDALASLISACVSLDRERRPRDAATLGAALKAIEVAAAQSFDPAQAQAFWDALAHERDAASARGKLSQHDARTLLVC